MNVAIAGYGIEGKANLEYWRAQGHDVTVLDEREVQDVPEGVVKITGPQAFQDLEEYDVVVRTASLRPDKLGGAQVVWSATNEFFAECPATIIGVTGTKGKGTTSSLIAAMLRAAGKKVHLVGNIGVPALSELPNIAKDDIVVYELSSFQLWDLENSPHIAVVLMIEPDHLDVHTSFEEYLAAKANIVAHQALDDRVVFCRDNQYSLAIAQQSEACAFIPYQDEEFAHVVDDTFYYGDLVVCSTSALQLPGAHNQDNACAAIGAVWELLGGNVAAIEHGLQSFTGLPHRLKFIREVNDVEYYDDSIATTPGSAIAAICSFDQPKLVILGGSEKGTTYDEVIEVCRQTKTGIIAIGQTGEKIHRQAQAAGVESHRVLGDMHEVVAKAYALAKPGSVVILCPASASFDQYKNYTDRGDQFIAALDRLAA